MRAMIDLIVKSMRLTLYAGSRGCTRSYTRYIYAVAAFVIIMTPAASAGNEQELPKLIHLVLSSSGIGIDELDDYLALGKGENAIEPNLVRWDQAEVTLGVVASPDVPAWLINSVTSEIAKMFRFVNRQINVCVRRKDRSSEAPSETPKSSVKKPI